MWLLLRVGLIAQNVVALFIPFCSTPARRRGSGLLQEESGSRSLKTKASNPTIRERNRSLAEALLPLMIIRGINERFASDRAFPLTSDSGSQYFPLAKRAQKSCLVQYGPRDCEPRVR